MAIISVVVLLFVVAMNILRILPPRRPLSPLDISQLTPISTGPFTLGSAKAEVQAAQGAPTATTDTVWHYGSSRVYFRGDRVVGWSTSPSARLKVGANTVEPTKAKRGYFTVGSTAAEVLAVQGPPTELTENVWRYGQSEVYFRNGRVIGWKSPPTQPLKAKAS